jgi:hypothetical protein
LLIVHRQYTAFRRLLGPGSAPVVPSGAWCLWLPCLTSILRTLATVHRRVSYLTAPPYHLLECSTFPFDCISCISSVALGTLSRKHEVTNISTTQPQQHHSLIPRPPMMRAERLDASLFPFFFPAELRLALGGFGARIIDRFNALCAQEFSLCDGAMEFIPRSNGSREKRLMLASFFKTALCLINVISICSCNSCYLL